VAIRVEFSLSVPMDDTGQRMTNTRTSKSQPFAIARGVIVSVQAQAASERACITPSFAIPRPAPGCDSGVVSSHRHVGDLEGPLAMPKSPAIIAAIARTLQRPGARTLEGRGRDGAR